MTKAAASFKCTYMIKDENNMAIDCTEKFSTLQAAVEFFKHISANTSLVGLPIIEEA